MMIEEELVNKADRLRIVDNINARFNNISSNTLEELLAAFIYELFSADAGLFADPVEFLELQEENKFLSDDLNDLREEYNELFENTEKAYIELNELNKLLSEFDDIVKKLEGMLE